MASRHDIDVTYEPEHVIEPIFTNGNVALDESGKILASSTGEQCLITNLVTGQCLARFEGDGEMVTNIALTPNASHVIICSRSSSMRIYALKAQDDTADEMRLEPSLVRSFKPHATPIAVSAVDQSGTLLATGSADGIIKVWDIARAYLTHTFRGHSGIISALHFFVHSEDENDSRRTHKSKAIDGIQTQSTHDLNKSIRLASGSEDGVIRIWHLASRKAIALLESHISVVRGLEFSQKLQMLISAGRDQTAVLWDARQWKMKRLLPVAEVIESVGFLGQNDTFIYTGGEQGRLKIWSLETGKEITHKQDAGDESESILELHRCIQGDFIMSVHTNHNLLFHSTVESVPPLSKTSYIPPLSIVKRVSGTHDEVIDMAFVSPCASLLALATNTNDVPLVLANPGATNDTTSTSPGHFGASIAALQAHSDIVICLNVDESGQWLVSGAKDDTARVWRIKHEDSIYEEWATFTGHAGSIGSVCFVDGNRTASSEPPQYLLTGSQDQTIKKWTIPRTANVPVKSLFTRKAHEKDINALAISPTQHLFATASQDRLIKVWSTEEGETQGVLRGHKRGVWSVLFTPHGTPAINREDNQSVASKRGFIVSGSGDKTVRIWSLHDYSCLRTLEGHSNSVLKVLWLCASTSSPQDDGDSKRRDPRVVSSGADGLVKVWDPFTSLCLATLDNHTDRVWALARTRNSEAVVSGAADGVVTFWKDTTSETTVARTRAVTERVEQDQQLQNCVREGKYREAIILALQLNHPARLLSVFQTAIDTYPPQPNSISGVDAVDDVVANLADEQLLALLSKVRDWNTNARTARVAQRILRIVVDKYDASRLAGLAKRRGGKEIVEALRAYTERHYRRTEELWEESFIVEYLLGEMNQLDIRDADANEDEPQVDSSMPIDTESAHSLIATY